MKQLISMNQENTRSCNKLQIRIRHNTGKAIADFNMIEDGDKVMVCLSGGKDSYTMLDVLLNVLLNMQKVAPISFSIIAVNLDQKQPGFPEHILPEYLTKLGVNFEVVEEDTYSIVIDKVPEGKTTCALCSRLRRGILHNTVTRLKATKIALGHHRDDMLETLFFNMFNGGQLKSMPPKLVSDDGKQMVIRPFAYCAEQDIATCSKHLAFPIIPCNLCGSQENLQRKVIKGMLQDWQQRFPGRIESMSKALQNVMPSHLADNTQFDFVSLKNQSTRFENGDIGFEPPKIISSDTSKLDKWAALVVTNI
jgi:tRNA 2-thiocytidine biosynthesis protein TtcA